MIIDNEGSVVGDGEWGLVVSDEGLVVGELIIDNEGLVVGDGEWGLVVDDEGLGISSG